MFFVFYLHTCIFFCTFAAWKEWFNPKSKLGTMLEAFRKTHDYLVEHVQVPARRVLQDEINWLIFWATSGWLTWQI